MSKINIKKTQLRNNILLSLAYGNKTFYDFTRKEELGSNSSILNELNKLLELDLIKEEERGPRNRKPYSITHAGLAFILIDIIKLVNVDKIAEAQKHKMPLLLGKWKKIRKFGLEDWVKEIIPDMTLYIIENIYYRIKIDEKTTWEHVFNLYHKAVFGPFLNGITEEQLREEGVPVEKIQKLIKDDPEIALFHTTALEEEAKHIENLGLSVEMNRKLFLS